MFTGVMLGAKNCISGMISFSDPRFTPPCRLFDADGKEISDWVQLVDLVTGLAAVQVRWANKIQVCTSRDPLSVNGKDIVAVIREYKAPLKMIDAHGKEYHG